MGGPPRKTPSLNWHFPLGRCVGCISDRLDLCQLSMVLMGVGGGGRGGLRGGGGGNIVGISNERTNGSDGWHQGGGSTNALGGGCGSKFRQNGSGAG